MDKLTNFVDYLNKTFLPSIFSTDKAILFYKIVYEKTINVIIRGLSNNTLNNLNKIKDKFELILTQFFGVVPNYSINLISNTINLTIIDISKINYNIFLELIKLNANTQSDCDNYFCTFKEYKSICLKNNKFVNAELYIEIFNRIRTVDFSSYPKDLVITSACKLLYLNFPSLNWINSQINYLNSLDTLSKKIINLYTRTGDKLINLYLRNGSIINDDIFNIFKLNYNDNINIYNQLMGSINFDINSVNTYIKRLIRRLRLIIDASPLIDNSFYVYRGRTDKVMGPKNYTLESFISTSLLTRVAVDFSKDKITSTYGSIIRFKLRGRALLLSNSKYLKEYEILLPFGYTYTLKSQQTAEFVNSIGQKINVNYVEYS